MARKRVELLVLHCTATPEGRDISADDVRKMHSARGWAVPGYHRLIKLDGSIEKLVSFNADGWVDPREVANGVRGFNDRSIHVAYAGGMTRDMSAAKDTRTVEQLASMEMVVKAIIKLFPSIKVAGHNQLAAKACPSFDTVAWLRSIGVEAKNIYVKRR